MRGCGDIEVEERRCRVEEESTLVCEGRGERYSRGQVANGGVTAEPARTGQSSSVVLSVVGLARVKGDEAVVLPVGDDGVEEGVGVGDDGGVVFFVDGRIGGEEDGGESEGGLETDVVEALGEVLSRGGVSVAVEEHVLNRLEGRRSRRDSERSACRVCA